MNEQWKYDEYEIIEEILEHIKGTYSEHYVNGEQNLQIFDIWKAQGSLETTSRDSIQKYLMRYGKKEGYNREDLLKAAHFIILMLHCDGERRTPKIVGNTMENTTGISTSISSDTIVFKDNEIKVHYTGPIDIE